MDEEVTGIKILSIADEAVNRVESSRNLDYEQQGAEQSYILTESNERSLYATNAKDQDRDALCTHRKDDKTNPVASALPQIVLKCPECAFVCASNNQICRHIFMTFHSLTKCADCDMHLLIWTYCPGVVKMLQRARKEGLISSITSIETPEKHMNRTHHRIGAVWTKEQFTLEGIPSDYGLTPLPRNGSVPSHAGCKFQCPVCLRVISTWTQMTKHLDATNHSVARCAQCDLPLKCYSTNQPSKHERLTKHRGLIGYFRAKEDYIYSEKETASQGKLPQFMCSECPISFFHTAYLAHHMISNKHATESAEAAPLPRCVECHVEVSLEEMERHQRETEHVGLVPDTTSEFAKRHALYPKRVDCFSSEDGNARRDRLVSKGNQIMYQCPDCVAIFSSWTKMEKHIFFTKHSLPKCAECGVYLRPRGWNCPEDHIAITGHQGLIGVVRKKFEYEVTVDMNDEELVELIDNPSNLPSKIGGDGGDGDGDIHLVFQCPLESCLSVFLSWVLLEKHFTTEHHGFISCSVCGEDVAPWKPRFDEIHQSITGHVFKPNEDVEPKTQLEEYQVTITDSELLTYYADKFQRCEQCNQVLDVSMVSLHTGGRRCQRNQERARIEKATLQRKQKNEVRRDSVTDVEHSKANLCSDNRRHVSDTNIGKRKNERFPHQHQNENRLNASYHDFRVQERFVQAEKHYIYPSHQIPLNYPNYIQANNVNAHGIFDLQEQHMPLQQSAHSVYPPTFIPNISADSIPRFPQQQVATSTESTPLTRSMSSFPNLSNSISAHFAETNQHLRSMHLPQKGHASISSHTESNRSRYDLNQAKFHVMGYPGTVQNYGNPSANHTLQQYQYGHGTAANMLNVASSTSSLAFPLNSYPSNMRYESNGSSASGSKDLPQAAIIPPSTISLQPASNFHLSTSSQMHSHPVSNGGTMHSSAPFISSSHTAEMSNRCFGAPRYNAATDIKFVNDIAHALQVGSFQTFMQLVTEHLRDDVQLVTSVLQEYLNKATNPTALHNAVLNVFNLFEPLSQVMNVQFTTSVKQLMLMYHQHLPWTSQPVDCARTVLNICRLLDSSADRVIIAAMHQFISEKCHTNGLIFGPSPEGNMQNQISINPTSQFNSPGINTTHLSNECVGSSNGFFSPMTDSNHSVSTIRPHINLANGHPPCSTSVMYPTYL